MALDEPCEPWPFIASCCEGWVDPESAPPAPEAPDETEQAAYEALAAAFNATQAIQTLAVRWASTVLWKRGRRKVGVCQTKVRVCPPFCNCIPCRCGPNSALRISSDLPIVEIISVTNVCTDVAIDPVRYGIIDSHSIGLLDGSCGWSAGFDCALEIEFSAGWEPDIEAAMAMSQLACEYRKFCAGEDCKTTEFLKLASTHRQGKRSVILTGLPLVDHWLIQAAAGGTSGMLLDDDMAYGLT